MQKKQFKSIKILMVFMASLVFLLALALQGNAAIDCNVSIPSVLSVGTELNITFNVSEGNIWNTSAALFIGSSSLTANNTFHLLANVSNLTNLRHINITFPPISQLDLEDGSDYKVFATCYGNATASKAENVVNSSVATGITIDRTIPQEATSVVPTGVSGDQTQTFSGTVVDENTTACTLRFQGTNPGSVAYVMTYSGSSCTVTLTNIPRSIYEYRIEVSDGTNVTSPALTKIQIDASPRSRAAKGAGVAAITAQSISKEGISRGLSIVGLTNAGGSEGMVKAKAAIQKELTVKEGLKTGGGVVAGAIIGTVVFPVVGTIIGGILGGVIGLLF